MKKIFISVFVLVLLLTGCSGDGVVISDNKGNSEKIDTYTYTDKETGCEYIIFDWYQGGGASPKLNSEGKPVGCKEVD